MVRPCLVVETQNNTRLVWEGDDLLPGCDGEARRLFRFLVERRGQTLPASELRAFLPHFHRQWKELCDALDIEPREAPKRRGPIYTVTLPPRAGAEQALLSLGKSGKSHYFLRVRDEAPAVSIESGTAVPRRLPARSPSDRIQVAATYLACATSLRGQNYRRLGQIAGDALEQLTHSGTLTGEALQLRMEAHSLRAVAFWLGDDGEGRTRPAAAWREVTQALHLSRDPDRHGTDILGLRLSLLTHQAWLAADLGTHSGEDEKEWLKRATAALDEAERLCPAVANAGNLYDVFNTRGYVLGAFERYGQAREFLHEARRGQSGTGDAYVSGLWADTNASALTLLQARGVDEAKGWLSHCVREFDSQSALRGQTAAWHLDQLVGVATGCAEWGLASELVGASDALHREVETALTPPERRRRTAFEAAARERLGEKRWRLHYRQGQTCLQEEGGLEHLISRTLI